ncbi:helix-turn-helix domain-containing protein, partial [Vibrio natriegens]
ILGVASTVMYLRKSKGLSQEELAERSNLDRTYISGIERGVRNITLESLELIIVGLGIDISKFIKELDRNIIDNKD